MPCCSRCANLVEPPPSADCGTGTERRTSELASRRPTRAGRALATGRATLNRMATPRTLTAAIHQEEDWYVAQCLEVDVASQGRTIAEAVRNLSEAVEIYLEEIDDPAPHLTDTPLVTSFQVSGVA